MKAAALILAVFAAGCAAQRGAAPVTESSPAPGIHATHRTFTYAVRGATAAEARKELNRLGPIDGAERRTDASTSAYIRWTYDYDQRPGSCGVANVQIEAQITLFLPVWSDLDDAPRGDRARWSRYMTSLLEHEAGHQRAAVEASVEMLHALEGVPAQPSCAELEARVSSASQGVFDRLNARNAEYDRATRHGLTQGAFFP